jgi:hypothetical protein
MERASRTTHIRITTARYTMQTIDIEATLQYPSKLVIAKVDIFEADLRY